MKFSPPTPPFHLPERTCKVFTRIYGRFSIHNRGVPVENKASSIVATHVSVPINRCPPRLSVSFTLPFFLSSLFRCTHSLVSSFYFRRRGISLWFPGRSAPFFLISLSSHFFHIFFFFFRQPWERLGMERERRGDITVGFSHGKRLAESPLC